MTILEQAEIIEQEANKIRGYANDLAIEISERPSGRTLEAIKAAEHDLHETLDALRDARVKLGVANILLAG